MLICVNYHYIRESFEAKFPSIFGIKPDDFRFQLETLSKFGTFISGEELGRKVEEDQAFKGINYLITFDDGLQEQFDLAYPILKEMGIPAMFFPNTGTLEEKDMVEIVHKIHLIRSIVCPSEIRKIMTPYLSSEIVAELGEIREKGIKHYKYDKPETAELKYLLNFTLNQFLISEPMNRIFKEYFNPKEVNSNLYMSHQSVQELADRGFIGSHGENHIPLGLQKENTKHREITGSFNYIEKVFGQKPAGFSFPYGSLDSVMGCQEHLQAAGYKFALTMERAINSNLSQPFAISRFDNNDMPLGKSFKFGKSSELLKYNSSRWIIGN